MNMVLIRYSRIMLSNGTIYNTNKGYTITRFAETLVIKNQAFPRIIHVSWTQVVEADFDDIDDTHARPEEWLKGGV